ncbi:hypothetical protein N0V88_000865 [Collariella sp. IMI 366227]|nr:hypothetical protein N0V88_000865 [Collariella sp. IMI 366227]
MSFDNGPQPPSMYSRQPSYPPQTPLSHSQSYEYQQPPQYGSHNDLPYQIQVAASSGKRKAQRASQACDSCRQLKAKCDELKPCKNCKEKGTECKYREAVPKQQDKIATDILDAILGVATKLDSNEDRMDKRMRRFENALRRIDPRALAFLDEDHRPESAGSAGPTSGDSSSLSPEGAATTALPIIDSLEARAITRNMEEETDAEPPGPVVPPGEPSIPVNHTTLAARLLEWDPIAVLIQDILETEDVNVGQFPIREEERRGLLRIWGRGEGLDSSHSGRNDTEAMRDAGVMEPPDDISDAGAPSPADCWGGISGSPAPIDGKSVIAVQTPDFSENVVYKYIQSFQDNIQNLHPLILPQELNAMVKLFLDTVQQSTARQSKSASIAKFVGSGASQSETGAKRKRRTEDEGGPESPPVSPRSAKPVFQRSINNALVLLALALGKICLHKDRLPDVVPVSEPLHGSPVARNGYPASPIQGSSPSYTSHSHSNSLPSPKDGAERPGASRRSSFQSGGPSMKGATSLRRNMDVIPGLDYFAYATDILGGQLAGTSLRHIHAYLLAGLYHGQLGRVLESYAYIKEAGYAVQIKMRPSLDRLSKITGLQVVTREADNRLLFAFWTCLQLESDIIAELPLPQSGVLAFEEMMPNPNMELAGKHGFDKRVLSSYLAQLYTRKSLNKIHKQLFDPNQKVRDEAVAPGGSIIEAIRSLLDLKTFVAPEFRFDPSDPPANDILSARLRAKYWGARVITHRHFVREILDHNFRRLMTNEPAGVGIPHITIEYAGEGVQALIESTRAFHELKEKRFIITNVFGTSHAQWGNLLVLSAVFRDPTLSQFIDEQLLRELFRRTIGFFRVIAHRTSALYKDMRILEGLERKLFRRQTNVDVADHPTGSSFSSHHSGGPRRPSRRWAPYPPSMRCPRPCRPRTMP